MKEKVKAISKIVVVLMLVLLSSCEKEAIENTHRQNTVISSKNVSLKELTLSKTNSKLLESVNQIKDSKSDAENKAVYNEEYDFYIDQEHGKYIQTTTTESYTFPIYRMKGDDNIENIIFTLNDEGGFDVALAKYDVTKEALESNMDDIAIPEEIKMLSSRWTEFYCDLLVCNNDGHGSAGGTHVAGPNCTNPNFLSYIRVLVYTNTGAGGNPTIPTGGSPGTGGATTGGTGGTSGSGGIITTPVTGYTTAQINFIRALNAGMFEDFGGLDYSASGLVFNYLNYCTPQQIGAAANFFNHIGYLWLTDQTAQAQVSILSYLVANNFSSGSVGFVNEMIEQASQNLDSFPGIVPLIIEKEIDDSQLPPCARNIVAKIKNLQQNDFATIIAKLGGANTPYKLTIKPKSGLPTGVLAYTNWVKNNNNIAIPYNYITYINSEHLVTSTDLGQASILLHELVHAYFFSLVDDHDLTGDTTLENFPFLWNYYVENFTGNGGNIAQHNQMAQSYVNILASALQEFQTGVVVPDGAQPLQIYKDLVWDGLKETTPYSYLSDSDKTRITNVASAEFENIPQNNGNGTNHLPLGSPCN